MSHLKEGLIWILGLLATFLAPIAGMMIVVGLAILLDTATGIWRSKKKGIKITSKGLRGLVFKMFFYETVIVLLFGIDWFIINDMILMVWDGIPFLLTKITALVLVAIEIMSIDENYKEVKGVSLIAAFKKLINKGKKIKEDLADFKSEEE